MWNIVKYLIFSLMFDNNNCEHRNSQRSNCLVLRPGKNFGNFLQLPKTNVVKLTFSMQLPHQDLCAYVYEVA